MGTYLLTSNPSKWDVEAATLARWIEQTREGESVPDRWSTGSRTSGIEPGDRAFLLRQGGGTSRHRHRRHLSEIENLAQDRLTAHYRAQGWTVEDMRYGNSSDARAMRDGDVLFLEAKGTTTAGESVIVTPGEVRFARANPGRCVMGVLSDIDVDGAGHVVPSSGTLRIIEWNPDAGHLEPLSYSFFPPY